MSDWGIYEFQSNARGEKRQFGMQVNIRPAYVNPFMEIWY